MTEHALKRNPEPDELLKSDFLVGLSVVIPAYNEADNIEQTIRVTMSELEKFGITYELLIVDDGSNDETRRLAQGLVPSLNTNLGAVRVLAYARNGGKGYAIRFGAAHTCGEFVAVLDADLDLHPRLLSRLLKVQQQTGADIVIGSKRHPASVIDYPVDRRLYSSAYYYLCRLLFGLPVRDTQTGIKLLRGDFVRRTLPSLRVNRFAFDLEMLAVAHRRGLRIAEAPVEVSFNRRFGRIGGRDIWNIGLDTVKVWWRLSSFSRSRVPRLGRAARAVRSAMRLGHPAVGVEPD